MGDDERDRQLPGQSWLWLYTFWYQIAPFKTSTNADALIWAIMAILTLALILVPFIPGIRSIPRRLPLYRLIWRDYYRKPRISTAPELPPPPASSPRTLKTCSAVRR